MEQFIQSARENKPDALLQIISDSYKEAFQEKINHPLLKQIATAKIIKAEQSKSGLPATYFLLTNEDESIKAIAEVFYKEITNLYAEGWSESQEDQENYIRLLESIELNGVNLDLESP